MHIVRAVSLVLVVHAATFAHSSVQRTFVALLTIFSAASVSAQTIAVGSIETAMTALQRIGAGLRYWPDGTMHGFTLGGTTYLFAGDGGVTRSVTSVSLDDLANNITPITTTTNIPKGGPNDFDRDYAGGGTVYRDAATGILLHLYHGEYWYSPPSGLPFYAGIGLAYSTDNAVTWHKVGQVISPQTARSGNCQVDVSGGTLLPVGDYFYLYYDDESAGCNYGNFNLAVARALKSEVIAAAQAGTPLTSGPGSLFKKFFGGSFGQDGVTDLANPQNGGGAFTPLLAGNSAWWPTVAFNSYLNKYVLAYAAAWNGIALRFSDDGISWGPETLVVDSGGAVPPNAIYYPSLFNTAAGHEPEDLGRTFYAYYVAPFGDWNNSLLMRVQITVKAPPTQRTFVASSGNDASPCSVVFPCRSFNAAIAQTSSGGEVIVLESAGYGTMVIDRPITIAAPSGVYAGISVASGTGIVVNPGSGRVALRGLTINGLGGTTGIDFQTGDALYVERTLVGGFTGAGLNAALQAPAELFVRDSIFRGNGTGASVSTSTGVVQVQTTIERSLFESNATGLTLTGYSSTVAIRGSVFTGGSNGIAIQPSISGAASAVDMRNTTVSKNATAGIVVGGNGATTATLSIAGSQLTGNGIGLNAQAGGTAYATDTTIARNTTGLQHLTGTIVSFGDNRLANNGTDGTFSSTVLKQ